MDTFRQLFVCCLFVFAAGLNKEEWLTAVRSLDSKYDTDQRNDDKHDLAALHTDDVIVMPPGLPTVYGIEAYGDAIRRNRTAEDFYWINQTFEEVVENTDEMAVVRLEFEFQYTSDSEKKQGKCIAILQNYNGTAMVKLVAWNYSF